MTVSIARMNIDYYLESAATGDASAHGTRDLTSYYIESQAPAGRWHGKGLTGINLDAGSKVEKWAAKAIYEDAVDPITKKPLGRAAIKQQKAPVGAKTPIGNLAKSDRQAVAGFDLTFSVPKSVSVLWALAGPKLQGELYAAHQQAIEEGLDWLEREVLQARSGHAGVAHVEVKGMIASLFDHWDSRAGDPQLHTHAVVANRVQRVSDGQWVTLDSYTLHRYVVALSEKYNSLLYDRIYERTGALAELRGGTAILDATDTEVVEKLLAETETDDRSPRAELIGVSDELLKEFSARSILVEQRTDELIAAWKNANGEEMPRHVLLRIRQEATLATRTPKVKSVETLPEKMMGWRKRTEEAGFDPRQVIEDSIGHEGAVITNEMIPDAVVSAFGAFVVKETGTKRSTFNRANLMASAERLLRGVRAADATTRELLLERVVYAAITQAVELSPHRMGEPVDLDPLLTIRGESVFAHREAAVFSNQTLMDDEALLMARVSDDAPALDRESAQAALAAARTREDRSLSPDQAEAALNVLSSGRALDAVIGPAGTGKTTTMRAVREVWESKYGASSVVGLAPSAVAASVLGEELDVTTDNVSKWLYESVGDGAARRAKKIASLESKLAVAEAAEHSIPRSKKRSIAAKQNLISAQIASTYAEHAKYQLRPDQLLIIDEASMVGTAAMAELNRQAAVVGAKVLLVGDPAQLGAVDAGGFLGWMERNSEVSMLSSVWRFSNEWERAASLQLRKGDENVIATYQEHERLVECKGNSASEQAYRAWLEDITESAATSLLIAADNETVSELNTRAQLDLAAEGRVDLENTVPLRTGEAGVGDVILARKNNRKLTDEAGHFVANGTRITLDELHQDGSVTGTRVDNGQRIRLDGDYLSEAVELGYACTAHRAQGVTVDTAHAVVTRGQQNRELLYVAMTRGRKNNMAYVDVPDETEHSPDEWGIINEIAPDTVAGVVKEVMATSSQELTAHEVQNAEHGKATDVGRMIFEYDYTATTVQTRSLIQWLGSSTTTEHIAQLQGDPQWAALVQATPSQRVPEGTDISGMSAKELMAACTQDADPFLSQPYVGMIAEPFLADSDVQEQVRAELEEKITERLQYLVDTVDMEDPPTWITELRITVPLDTDFERVLPAVVAWRSVSNQEDSETPWGKEPSRTDKFMHGYYQRARSSLPAPLDVSGELDPGSEPVFDAWSDAADFTQDDARINGTEQPPEDTYYSPEPSAADEDWYASSPPASEELSGPGR